MLDIIIAATGLAILIVVITAHKSRVAPPHHDARPSGAIGGDQGWVKVDHWHTGNEIRFSVQGTRPDHSMYISMETKGTARQADLVMAIVSGKSVKIGRRRKIKVRKLRFDGKTCLSFHKGNECVAVRLNQRQTERLVEALKVDLEGQPLEEFNLV